VALALVSLAYGVVYLRLASQPAGSPQRAALERWKRRLGRINFAVASASFLYLLTVLTDWSHPIQKYPPQPLPPSQPGEDLLAKSFFLTAGLIVLHLGLDRRRRSIARWRFPDAPGLSVAKEWSVARQRQALRDFERWTHEVGATQDEDLRFWHRIDRALVPILYVSAAITASLFLKVFLPVFLTALEKAG